MARNTIRPTNVRASVGSRASGSSANAIVNVPPFLATRVGPAPAAATAVAKRAAAKSITSVARLRLLLIESPSHGYADPRRAGLPHPNAAGAETVVWIQFRVKWIPRGKVAAADGYGSSTRERRRARRPSCGDDPVARPQRRDRVG